MRCNEIQDRLSAVIDGELGSNERSAVEQHLAQCSACREAMTELQSLDVQLRRATAPSRDRAPHIASAALLQLPPSSPPPTARQFPRLLRRDVLLVAGAMACGFLLAVLLPGPWRNTPTHSEPPDATVSGAPPDAPAFIRVATGPVEVATTPADWTTLANPDGFACRAGVAVRTTAAAVCELETSGGATVRMNSATELAFVDKDDIRLAQGEIWCRTPDAARLKVTPVISEAPPAPPVTLFCGPEGPAACVLTCPTSTVNAKVCVAVGTVEIVSSNHSEQVAAGRSVEIRDGTVQPAAAHNRAQSERWMHPLLVRRGPANQELAERVNSLLAEVGRSKLSYLRERDLRSLGESGALPLLRFLQAEPSIGNATQRETAARILSDVAPAWMTPELIELLADGDPSVRISAATALRRLTGETQGMDPDAWGEPDQNLQPAIALWRVWWDAERPAYPIAAA